MNPNTCPPGQGNPNPGGNTTIIMGAQPNLVINGGMTVSQRGTSFTSVSSTQYTLDRWELEFSGSPGAVVDVSQEDTDVPAGSGLSKSLKIDCTTAEAAVGASEAIVLKTTLEAQDLQQLMYGDALTAQSTSLSFWIKSPKSGIHCVALYMDDGSVHNIQEFLVTTANEWSPQQVVFPGYAAAAIADDNGAGLTISFPLVAGTDFQAGKEVWESGNDYATSEQQNLLDNTANNFCVTGVKLEVGDIATPFEHRRYGDELSRCQRYFQQLIENIGGGGSVCMCMVNTTTQVFGTAPLITEMRVAPSLSISSASHFRMVSNNTSFTPSAIVLNTAETYNMSLQITISAGTAGYAGFLEANHADSRMSFDAEY